MNIFSIAGLFIFIASIVLSLYTLLNGKKKAHFIWGFFSLAVAIWGFGIFKFANSQDIAESLRWWRFAEIGVIFIPILLTHFVFDFLKRKQRIFIYFLYALAGIYTYLDLFTDYYVRDLRFVFNEFYYIVPTPVFTSLIVIFILLVIYNIIILFKAQREANAELHHQIKYLYSSFLIGFTGGASSFLPVYGVDIYPIYNIAIVISALIVVYSMFKNQFLALKVIATQLLVFSLWFFLFGRILLSQDPQSRIIDIGLLVAVIIFGILLIQSVLKEINTREMAEKLAEDLEVANARLKELDQQKSEFVSIASHQLRSPLTAIRGYTSMILEGSFGEITPKAREAIERVTESSRHLVNLVEDLLNISRIEQGRMVYDFTSVDVGKMTEDIIGALLPNAQKNKLDVSFTTDGQGPYNTVADYEKIRQVVLNLVDNAIKYTPKGFVKVKIERNKTKNKILLSVRDSGVGVTPELKGRLFEKFSRGDEKTKLHVNGMGLGLYVAKEMLKAHNGNIWVESLGEGKGATFFIEFTPEEETKQKKEISDFAKTL